MKSLVFLLITASIPTSCTLRQGCLDTDIPCMQLKKQQSPILSLSYWQDNLKKPIHQRIHGAEREVLTYLRIDNQLSGYPEYPVAEPEPDPYIQDITDALKELPAEVKNLFTSKLAGIVLVNDLGGTGYSEIIKDPSGNSVAGFIVLDSKALDQKANQWATWKENTVFHTTYDVAINVTIENPLENNRKNAFQFILLHELGHILSIGEQFHPPWGVTLSTAMRNLTPYRFTRFSWTMSPNHDSLISLFDTTTFPSRKQIHFYFGPKKPASDAVSIYKQLETTNFVTLYGATNVFDDFADGFATYVHSILMHKPYEIVISVKGKPVQSFQLCWQKSRCHQKKQFFDQLIPKPSK